MTKQIYKDTLDQIKGAEGDHPWDMLRGAMSLLSDAQEVISRFPSNYQEINLRINCAKYVIQEVRDQLNPRKPKEPDLKEMEDLYWTAYIIGTQYIEKTARSILASDPHLKEFIMCMGHAWFTDEAGESLLSDEELLNKDASGFLDFVTANNDRFGFTGEPMRFTATGPKITDW